MIIATTAPTYNTQKKCFPKLMTHPESGAIVLFINPTVGTYIKTPSMSDIGRSFTNGWKIEQWEDYEGKITLSNQ